MKPGKLDELQCIVENFQKKIHIIIIVETWIKNENDAIKTQLPNYDQYLNYRTTSKGGGVSIFVLKQLKHEFLEEQYDDGNHFLWIHLKNFNLDIGAIYKPPISNDNNFLQTFSNQITRRKRAIVFGDINFNLLSKQKVVRDYKTIVKENGFQILNKVDKTHCTRVTKVTATILDHVCTTLSNSNSFHMSLINSSMSDHRQIYVELKRHKPIRPERQKYEKVNYDKLIKSIKENSRQNTEDELAQLENLLIENIAKYKETKIKIQYSPKHDWINRHLIECIDKRNELWHKLQQSPEDKNLEEEFLKQKQLTHKRIQNAKSEYYVKVFNNCKSDPQKMWQLINNFAHNKTKQNTTPSKLVTSSGQITEIRDICEYLNQYFAKIGAELASKIPKSNRDNVDLRTSNTNTDISTLTQFKPATAEEILKIIKILDINTSSGIDQISTKVIKSLSTEIVDELTRCINKCLREGIFPDSLKVARVTPIYKAGSKSDPGNFRPISVLPVLSKILEKVLHNRLIDFLDNTKYLYKKQYGFRPKSSTLTAAADLITSIKVNIDKKKITLGVFVDLKKAFDTVSHEILLIKLNNLGVRGPAYKMFMSYLTNRHQIVKLKDVRSSPQSITCGVPQGSILGPLLFLIYINDIHLIGLKGDLTLYADDTALFYSGNSIKSIMDQAQCDLDLLNSWLQSNLLTINTAKTNYIIFAAKNKQIDQHKDLTINNQIIHKVSKEKYLGLILDKQLTWTPHIQNIRKKLTSLIAVLRGTARCLPIHVKNTIYNSLVKSHLQYLIELWGTAAKSNLKDLQISQNKLIKTLFGYNHRTPSAQLYKKTKFMNIAQLYKFNTCILIRKLITKEVNSQIILTKRAQTHKIITRQANNLCLRMPRTNYGKKNILYEGAKFYNSLPKLVKTAKSLTSFKKSLKNHILCDHSLLS